MGEKSGNEQKMNKKCERDHRDHCQNMNTQKSSSASKHLNEFFI